MFQTIFERQLPQDDIIRTSLAHTRYAPYWLEALGERPVYPRLPGERRTELVIVGGGLVGLWTALLAKERFPEQDVMLLEARQLGWAASGRNGGFCEASLTHGEKNGQRRWPEEYATLHAMGLKNLDEMEETIARYGIDCDFERTGEIVVAVEPYQDEELRGKATWISNRCGPRSTPPPSCPVIGIEMKPPCSTPPSWWWDWRKRQPHWASASMKPPRWKASSRFPKAWRLTPPMAE